MLFLLQEGDNLSAYKLTSEYIRINEESGILQNTAEQKIEYMLVPAGKRPLKGGGKQLDPMQFAYFEIEGKQALWVRLLIDMPGIETMITVNSALLLHNKDDNPNIKDFLRIGLTVWRAESFFPVDWCVLYNGTLYQCTTEHYSSTDFMSDFDYWKCLDKGIVELRTTEAGSLETTDVIGNEGSILITSYSAIFDSKGNKIDEYYASAESVSAGLSSLNKKIDTKVSAINDRVDTEVEKHITDVAGLVTMLNTLGTELDTLDTKLDTESAKLQKEIEKKADESSLSAVATSGSYNDLSDKPFIPSKVSQIENDSDYATRQEVANRIADIIANAPADLDTLKEIADYIEADKTNAANIATSISNLTKALEGKQDAGNYSVEGHEHDDRYYTKSDVDTALLGKSDSGHTHDDRYYTESEVDTKLEGKSDVGHTHSQYLTEHQDISGKSDVGHTHDDRYYTESEVDTKLEGKSDVGHTHSQYLTSHQDISGKANTSGTYVGLSVGYAASAGSAPANGGTSSYTEYVNNDYKGMRFHWCDQSGQPPWLWGGADGENMYLYNPSNFSVNYATSSGGYIPGGRIWIS